jgi:hypothetical protein
MSPVMGNCFHPAKRVIARLASREMNYGISPGDLKRVDAVWERLGRDGARPRFEKIIINALDVNVQGEGVAIVCGFMRYRCLVVRLHEELRSITPLAVSGVVCHRGARGDSVLIGRRSSKSTSHAGWYETPPSGGLEAEDVSPDGHVDLESRIIAEFAEETSLVPTEHTTKVSGIYLDAPTNTIDVIYKFYVVEIEKKLPSSGEYDSLEWMALDDISTFLAKKKLVPLSRRILENILRERTATRACG